MSYGIRANLAFNTGPSLSLLPLPVSLPGPPVSGPALIFWSSLNLPHGVSLWTFSHVVPLSLLLA